MITITDVAKKAGVSTATVSHVCNNTRFVSEELRKKVTIAMEELHYYPNMMARGLKGGSLKTIGVILPDCTNSFFAEISQSLDHCFFAFGYNIILCNTDNNIEHQSYYIDMLISKHVDGIIFISSNNTNNDIQKLANYSIPAVVVDRDVDSPLIDTILVNNKKGGFDAAEHLISRGFTKIACITGPQNITSSNQRLEGFKEALKKHDIELPSQYVYTGDFHFKGGSNAFDYFFSQKDIPQAVFAANDMMALGFIKKAVIEGITIPKDISLIGFDNTQLSNIASPKLTTLAQPIDELSEIATRQLLGKIEKNETKISRIVLDPTLIVRETCI